VSILERLLYQQGRAARTSDRQRATAPTATSDGHASKPDMLPLTDQSAKYCQRCSVLAVVTGDASDHEIMALACAVAKEKHTNVVHAIYGIEVPRSKAVNDEMPAERERANAVLSRAAEDAKQCDIEVDKEYIQSRHFGQSLVDAAANQGCALLIIGLPFKAEAEGEAALTDTVDYVLKHATCRVWVVRGQPPAGESDVRERTTRHEPAATR
jgi:nucleotide-binding universal stress UspA family protein